MTSKEKPENNVANQLPRHIFANMVGELAKVPAIGSKRELIISVLNSFGVVPVPVEPEVEEMTFGAAIDLAIRENKRIARAGWNGKGQYAFAVDNSAVQFALTEDKSVIYDVAPTMGLKNAQDVVYMGWVPSIGDLFATDWIVVK